MKILQKTTSLIKNSLFAIRYSLFIILLIFSLSLFAQQWTEPVNVSNMQGILNQPDLCIDKNGTLHCVWAYKIGSNFWKIYYSNSYDDGLSWTQPEDISLNKEKWVSKPHIISNSENILYFTYNYNVGNPSQTHVCFKYFNGVKWSDSLLLSEGMPGSKHNKLAIDNNDRLYCFWYHNINNGTIFYRYFENNYWSDIIAPYYNMNSHSIETIIVDINDNLQCAGRFSYSENSICYIHYFYNYIYDFWSDISFITGPSLGEDMISLLIVRTYCISLGSKKLPAHYQDMTVLFLFIKMV